jgi:copper chaperone NosL
MSRSAVVILLTCAALAACDQNSEAVVAFPREPDSHVTGYYCRMTLSEHPGPKGQLLLKGSADPLWFSSVRDALTYIEQDLTSESAIAGFWVNDMAQGTWEKPAPGSWIGATSAWYVLGSGKTASMGGGEAVPFKERAQAEAFVREFGGSTGDYRAARREVAKALAGGVESGGGL